MDDVVRVLVIAAVALFAAAAGLAATRFRGAAQPPAHVEGLGFESAIVAFTSTDCPTCRKVMARLSALDVPVREVAYELEPALFEASGVEGVPLVVVVTPAGERVAQFGGTVSKRRLWRALTRAGW